MYATKQKLADIITDRLESKILDGTFVAGERLPSERELAAQYDVSRPSLREAMGNLHAKGLIERKQGGGTYISKSIAASTFDPLFELIQTKPETQFDLLEFRHALEGMAAYYAALRGQADDHHALEQALETLSSEKCHNDLATYAKALSEFYLTMAKATQNWVLIHVMRSMKDVLEDNIKKNLDILLSQKAIDTALAEQRTDIVKAIVKRDPELARQASNRHLAYIETTLLKINQRDSRVQRALRRIDKTE